MPAVGMLLGLGGYGIALWGYCLLSGQNVKLTQLFNPVNVYKWGSGGSIPDTSLLPAGATAAVAGEAAGGSALAAINTPASTTAPAATSSGNKTQTGTAAGL